MIGVRQIKEIYLVMAKTRALPQTWPHRAFYIKVLAEKHAREMNEIHACHEYYVQPVELDLEEPLRSYTFETK